MTASPDGLPGEAVTLELLEEQAAVSRRVVAGATVRVATTTTVRAQQIDAALARERVEVERVLVGRIFETAPDIRQEGDVTIVPVMEEVLVLERQLVLKEEVRIRRVRTTEAHRETVQLRQQEATVTRLPAGPAAIDARQPDTPTTNN